MHEFKHVIDHDGIGYLYPDAGHLDSARRAELAADYFAACILMPKKLVKRRFGEGLHDVGDLAAEFGVSPVAMRYRLHQLRIVEPAPRCDHRYQKSGNLTGYLRRAWSPKDVLSVGGGV